MELYVGNLPSDIPAAQLETLFKEYGEVSGVRIVTDKFSGLPRGFAFVNMPKHHEAVSAIKALSGQALHDQILVVTEAQTQSHLKNVEEE